MRRDPGRKPVSVKALAQQLDADAWHTVQWREGTNVDLASRFAAVRLRPASRDYNRSEPRPEEWLMVEWPEDTAEPTKYWLSTMPAETSIEASSGRPSCVGGSNGTIRTSNKTSA